MPQSMHKEIVRTVLTNPAVSHLFVRPLRLLGLGSMLHRIPIAGIVRIPTGDGTTMLMDTARGLDAIAAEAFWRGPAGYEPEVTRHLRILAENCRTFLDIGANTGLYSILVAGYNRNTRLVCFEPVPRIVTVHSF